jgi:hypothetical protein
MDMTKALPKNSKHLTAEALGAGARVRVRIASVEMAKLGSDTKPVVYFQGKQKGLALNPTNNTALIDLLGPESDDWIGREIVLYTTKVDYQGRRVLGIRVDAVPATESPRQPSPQPKPQPPVDPVCADARREDQGAFLGTIRTAW